MSNKVDKLLEIKNLNVIYETDEDVSNAVNGVNLDLIRGETLGIVGETGAGKTTMALSIMQLLPKRVGKIISGEILLEGDSLIKMSEVKKRKIRGEKIAMIFQDPMTSLNPVIPIGEQIEEVLEIHGKLSKNDRKKRVDEILKMVGIGSERKNDYPHQFSGGMKQRVVIAIAIVSNPELLIADEPTTALDVTIQAQVLEMMEELKKKLNTSMILITHDLGVVAQTCDRVGIMYAGEIIEYGTAEDIYTSKLHHPYTEGLFGSIPDLNTETKRLNPIKGLMPDPTNLPKGCKFHPRCPRVMEICKTELPNDYFNNSHRIKCHLYKSN